MSKRNVVHVEIPSANVEAAGKFYQELFGWKLSPMPEMNYTMWEDGSGSGGGARCGGWCRRCLGESTSDQEEPGQAGQEGTRMT